jgi:hypothetical protein
MLAVAWTLGIPSLPWAIALWVASECVLVVVSSWVLRRVTGYSVLDQFGGMLKPLFATLLMALTVIETRLHLLGGLGPVPRLLAAVPLGVIIYVGAIFLLDRPLVKDFLAFVRSALERNWQPAAPR